MAYVKTNWQTGDTVTAEKLNHIEQGIAGAGQMMAVSMDRETSTLQSTWQEIHDALKAGVFVYLNSYFEEDETSFYASLCFITDAGLEDGVYYVNFFDWLNVQKCETDSPTGYPVLID